MLRHSFNYDRWVAADGRVRGQEDPAVILKALRNAAANRKALPGARPVRGLTHVLVHGQGICRPLGISRDLPEAHLLPVADSPAEALVMMMAGRSVALDDLSGEGKTALVTRYR